MGCFDYECECGGTKCVYVGGQHGGNSDVVVEVPLNDGTTVYIKGRYESYGWIRVGDYQFYPEQFEDYFEGWINDESDEARRKMFLAKRVWTISYSSWNEDDNSIYKVSDCCPGNIKIVTKLGKATLEKCIRVDAGLNIPSDDEKRKMRIAKLKSQIEALQRELDELNKL